MSFDFENMFEKSANPSWHFLAAWHASAAAVDSWAQHKSPQQHHSRESTSGSWTCTPDRAAGRVICRFQKQSWLLLGVLLALVCWVFLCLVVIFMSQKLCLKRGHQLFQVVWIAIAGCFAGQYQSTLSTHTVKWPKNLNYLKYKFSRGLSPTVLKWKTPEQEICVIFLALGTMKKIGR